MHPTISDVRDAVTRQDVLDELDAYLNTIPSDIAESLEVGPPSLSRTIPTCRPTLINILFIISPCSGTLPTVPVTKLLS